MDTLGFFRKAFLFSVEKSYKAENRASADAIVENEVFRAQSAAFARFHRLAAANSHKIDKLVMTS